MEVILWRTMRGYSADRVQTRFDFIDLRPCCRAIIGRGSDEFVESLDLSGLYEAIKAREGEPGRPPSDRPF